MLRINANKYTDLKSGLVFPFPNSHCVSYEYVSIAPAIYVLNNNNVNEIEWGWGSGEGLRSLFIGKELGLIIN